MDTHILQASRQQESDTTFKMIMTDINNDTKDELAIEGISFSKWEVKVIFNNALASVKVNNLNAEDRINLIKLKIGLGKAAASIQEYEKTVVESLKDDTYTDAEKAAQSPEASDEDKEAFAKIQSKLEKDASEACMSEYNDAIRIPCKYLTEETFYSIAEYFDMQMLGGYDYIYNKLVK